MNESNGALRGDLLTPDEEAALTSLRQIVDRLRKRDFAVDVCSMEDDIRTAGGKRVHSTEAEGPDTFLLGGARFSLRSSPTEKGKMEVLFLPLHP